MKKTILMAAVLAIATVLTVGLAALPGSVQEAQANPSSVSNGDILATAASTATATTMFLL